MLKIYDEEVFIIELEEFQANARQVLDNVIKNPDYEKMVFLLKRAGKIIAATNLYNFLKNNIVFKTFSEGGGVFAKARDYCADAHVPYGTYLPVLNDFGECIYLLYYMENKIYTNYFPGGRTADPLLRYDLEGCGENLDYSLVESVDVYFFSELEEYTYAIMMILAKKYPDKPLIILDKRISYFPELADSVVYMDLAKMDMEVVREKYGRKQCLWVISDGVNYNGFPYGYLIDVYNSINVMYSMYWCSIKECFGEKNKGRTILLVDYAGGKRGKAGLVDFMKFIFPYYIMSKRRGWGFSIDLSRKPNQYLMSESDNMWDYFFEPLSSISLQEVYESDSVIRLSVNDVDMHSDDVFPQFRNLFFHTDCTAAMKGIRFNQESRAKIGELMPKILKKENHVLGVILRGTDFRPEAYSSQAVNIKCADIDKMIVKCRWVMRLYGYTHIFLATEDSEYFERMKREFGEKCLSIDQKRVFFDYKTEFKHCSDLLEIKDGKEFGMIYLAVIQSLANCKSLLSNVECGAVWAAKGLNDSKYEYYEVVAP